MKTLKSVAIILVPLLLWMAFVALGFVQGYLLRPLASDESPEAFVTVAKEEIEKSSVGNLAMMLIEDGEISETYYHSSGKAVDENTIFPVASISKWATAVGVMKLVQSGQLDLDRPVEEYLTRWQLPNSEYDNRGVTIRRLLSHSAGLVDQLGYAGFGPDEKVQSLEESLTKAADAPWSDGVAAVGYEPGSEYMYSGGSYTLLQLIIEEITGQSYVDYMATEVFSPLGMTQSTFSPDSLPDGDFAPVYKTDGRTRPMKRFTALAAASLYTSVSDLSKLMKAHLSANPVLSAETIDLMAEPTSYRGSVPVYGLGPHLYSQLDEGSQVIGHDGSGNDAINTAARVDLLSKDGIIILATGHESIASILADEWLFWKFGIADFVVMQRNIPYLFILFSIGAALIIIGAIIILKKRSKS